MHISMRHSSLPNSLVYRVNAPYYYLDKFEIRNHWRLSFRIKTVSDGLDKSSKSSLNIDLIYIIV